jgi:hypothetical protein
MSGCHILVQSLDGGGSAQLSILLVHVVCARSGVVSDPDAKVLDLGRALLVDDVQGDDLAVGLLNLAELHQEVPEAGLGYNSVVGEYAHAVEFRSWVGVGRQVAADDLVFLEATWDKLILV